MKRTSINSWHLGDKTICFPDLEEDTRGLQQPHLEYLIWKNKIIQIVQIYKKYVNFYSYNFLFLQTLQTQFLPL